MHSILNLVWTTPTANNIAHVVDDMPAAIGDARVADGRGIQQHRA